MKKINIDKYGDYYRVNNVSNLEVDIIKNSIFENVFCSLMWEYLYDLNKDNYKKIRILDIWAFKSKLQKKFYPTKTVLREIP